MRIGLRRGFGAVVAGVAMCVFVSPTGAHAVDGPDPVLSGDCSGDCTATAGAPAATEATPLTVDTGAAADAPGVVTVGLGSAAEGTNGYADPLLTVPARDTLDGLGVRGAPVVSGAATEACAAAKQGVNELGATVQGIVPGDDVTEPGPAAPQSPAAPSGGSSGGDVDPTEPDAPTRPGNSGPEFGAFDSPKFTGFDLPAVLGGFDPIEEITLPPAVAIGPPVHAPEVAAPASEGNLAEEEATDSGALQAAPAAPAQERLPLLLAVLTLALVGAGLSKTFHGRRTT